jgi:hypothetical protein
MARQSTSKAKGKYFGSVHFFKHMITSLVLVTIIGLVGAVVFLSRDSIEPKNPDALTQLKLDIPEGGDGRGIVVTPENVVEMLNQTHDDTQYATQMSAFWTFDTWNTMSANAYVGNSTQNTRMMYFEVALNIGTANEPFSGPIVLDSPYIPVGAKWEYFALDTPLDAGVYDTILTYYLVDDDFQVITTVSVFVEVTILNDAYVEEE